MASTLLLLLLLTQYEILTVVKTWISNLHYHALVPLYLKALFIFYTVWIAEVQNNLFVTASSFYL